MIFGPPIDAAQPNRRSNEHDSQKYGSIDVGALGATWLPTAAVEPSTAASEGKAGALSDLVSLDDFERAARKRMAAMDYEFVASGAGDEVTIRWNREDYNKLKLRPRVLVDVEALDTSLELFGQTVDFPILRAPTSLHRLTHPEGEVETARGAGAANATFVVSSLSTRRMADIARATSKPLWFQLYGVNKERHGSVRDVVQEVKELGLSRPVCHGGCPVLGARYALASRSSRWPACSRNGAPKSSTSGWRSRLTRA